MKCVVCGTVRVEIPHAFMWRGRTYTGMACTKCNDVVAPIDLKVDVAETVESGKTRYDWYPETPMGRAAAEDMEC